MIFDILLDAVFPGACVGCARELAHGAMLCDTCFAHIRQNRTLFCGTCNARLPDNRRICHSAAPYCYGSAMEYHDKFVRALIHALKFKSARRAAEPLVNILLPYTRTTLPPRALRNALIVPIPLSAARERRRGFNQALLLATPIARDLGLPLEQHLLARVRHTKPQSELADIAERRANVAQCFTLAKTSGQLARRPIILVDDVRTSGATLNEAATTLRVAGAGPIYGIVAARA